MPLCTFTCLNCSNKKEHFVYKIDAKVACPKCSSENYKRDSVCKFKAKYEYADPEEWVEKQVNPYVNEVYEKIGREALDFDTKTAENIFGEDKVADTFVPYDEA
jgi:predicted patatin/cPLA2 family phospholipase